MLLKVYSGAWYWCVTDYVYRVKTDDCAIWSMCAGILSSVSCPGGANTSFTEGKYGILFDLHRDYVQL